MIVLGALQLLRQLDSLFLTVGNGRSIGLRVGLVSVCLHSAQLREHWSVEGFGSEEG